MTILFAVGLRLSIALAWKTANTYNLSRLPNPQPIDATGLVENLRPNGQGFQQD